MYPTLFEIFGEPVPAYFTMLITGFVVATLICARGAAKLGLDRDVMIDVGLYSVIWGVAGGRILHVLADGYFWNYVYACVDPTKVEWQITRGECRRITGGVWNAVSSTCHPSTRDCFAWAAFWQGGLAYYGGLIAALAFGVWLLRREKFPVGKGLDLVGMVLPLGVFFGRMGCFLGGCCFGLPHDGPFGVSFPPSSPASEAQWRAHLLTSPHVASLPVHPTQLYEAIGCLAIAGYLIGYGYPRKRFDGQVILLFLALYAALRFGIEYLRADDRGGLLGLSTSQWISVVAVAAVAAAWRFTKTKAHSHAHVITS